MSPEYPELTPYQFASNRPIDGIDLDGLEYLDSDEAHVRIRSGGVYLVLENFSNVSRNNFMDKSNLYISPVVTPDCPTGCIGLPTAVLKFKISNLPSDLESGVSMDNGVTPSVDPTVNPYRQKVEGERRPLVHSKKMERITANTTDLISQEGLVVFFLHHLEVLQHQVEDI